MHTVVQANVCAVKYSIPASSALASVRLSFDIVVYIHADYGVRITLYTEYGVPSFGPRTLGNSLGSEWRTQPNFYCKPQKPLAKTTKYYIYITSNTSIFGKSSSANSLLAYRYKYGLQNES